MKYVMSFALLALLVTPAFADDLCQSDCPENKVKISFADGNSVTCMCVDPGEGMQENGPFTAEQPAEGDA